MIRINLLAQAQPAGKPKAAAPKLEGAGRLGQNVLMTGVVLLAFLFIGWRWYSLASEAAALQREIAKAEQEKQRLQAIIKKGEEYKAKKELLQRKITLITQLKKNQSGPVHLLDEISKQLPDFLWLDSMTESAFNISIAGKATTYNAVSNFYNNLTGSRYFQNVVLGPISSIPVGVQFSLSCHFLPQPVVTAPEGSAGEGGAPAAGGAPGASAPPGGG
jgi:type IV pilus assembly protein PilN